MESTPRRAIEAANLVLKSMMKVDNGRRAAKKKMIVHRCGAKQLKGMMMSDRS